MMLLELLLTFFCVTATLSDIIVTTPNGRVRGLQKLSARNNTYNVFLQIPYAQPPLDSLRFKDPQPATAWTGILNATQETKICYQMASNSDLESEDCLYLNVYSPFTTTKRRCSSLPVMFYIHGGGFINGNSLYRTMAPHYFMDSGVVVVTASYRLGPFGFLSTGDSVVRGNYGLKDQNLALKWVQQNIRHFGGDPQKVTIFGQSSGAVSVGYHILSSQSKGLFRGAIEESGSVLTPHGYQRRARDFAYTLAKFINPNISDSIDSSGLLNFLQNVSAEEIDTATEKFTQAPGSMILSEGSWFAPVIEEDHEDAFINDNMYESLEKGNFNKVSLMLGMTSEEAVGQAADLVAFKATVAQFDNNVTFLVPGNMHITNLTNKTLAGEDIRDIYTDGQLQDNLGAAVKYFSDSYVSRPIIKHAELQSAFTDVYFYQFSYHGALGNNNVFIEGAGKVGHSEDLRYLWVFSNTPDINEIAAEDLRTLDRYVKLYTNFAKSLNPTPESDSLFENVSWPKFNQQTSNYLDIDKNLTIKTNPKEPAFSKWVDAYNKWAIPPFDTF